MPPHVHANTRAAKERADRDVVSKHSIAKAHATVAVIQESDSTHIHSWNASNKSVTITLFRHTSVAESLRKPTFNHFKSKGCAKLQLEMQVFKDKENAIFQS